MESVKSNKEKKKPSRNADDNYFIYILNNFQHQFYFNRLFYTNFWIIDFKFHQNLINLVDLISLSSTYNNDSIS